MNTDVYPTSNPNQITLTALALVNRKRKLDGLQKLSMTAYLVAAGMKAAVREASGSPEFLATLPFDISMAFGAIESTAKAMKI